MMRLLPLSAALLLVACDTPDENHKPVDPQAPRSETVFDPMTNQLDRAKRAADRLPDERKESLDQAIDASGN